MTMSQTNFESKTGRVAGVDYGTVRIGLAISDPDRILSSPFETYVRKNEKADAEYFRRFVQEERVAQFVVGLPLHLSGDISEKSKEATAFAAWLAAETGIPVDFVDERYTSVEAERHLRGAKFTNKRRQDRRDMIAAQILLATYLESGPIKADDARLE